MKLEVLVGDITKQDTDAIVNAANSYLFAGAGVDGAIHKAAGNELQEACTRIQEQQYPHGIAVSEAVITPGFKLNAKHIIHSVGPQYTLDPNPALALASTYSNVLRVAEEHSFRSIAIPAISTGEYGFPKEEAARIIGEVFREFNPKTLTLARLIYSTPQEARLAKRHLP